MKMKYTGLKAEKIDFGRYEAIATSLPPTCQHIVADTVEEGASTCSNPEDTTLYMWWGNGTGDFPDP